MTSRPRRFASGRFDRRTLLRGAGVACALPLLESIGRAVPTNDQTPPKRLCYVYFPNGVSLPSESDRENSDWRWFPTGEGNDYRLTKVLSPLESMRSEMTILSGFSHPNSRRILGHAAGDTWLTGGDIRGTNYRNTISADQLAARHLSQQTRYPSLVLSTDGGVGYRSRVSTLSFGPGGMPVPSENRHREIFERYFSPASGATSADRKKSLQAGKKIVDLVLEDARDLNRRLSQQDKHKVDEFLTSVSSVEEQIRRNEEWIEVPLKPFDASHLEFDVNAAIDPQAYIRSMFDLIVLGLQIDITRVVTYMMAREDGMGFGENFPKLALGFKKGHHTISHDQAKGHWAEWGSYDQWLAGNFAYFLEKLKTTSDNHGPLLDNTLVLYGSACSSTHNARNYPLVLAGGSNLGAKHGTYIKAGKEQPMSNLLASMLGAVDVPIDHFADSTGKLDQVFG